MRRVALASLAALLQLALVAPAFAADPEQTQVQPLEQAHAHNDYEHGRPLLDALDHGFTSVEADVYLVGDQLLVAHDPEDLRPARTLEALYLDPLAERARANRGSVYDGYDGVFQLLIDIKTEPVSTYLRLHEVLADYRRTVTGFRMTSAGYRAQEKAVMAVISGNRPMDLMARQRVRYAGYDGRLSDLTSGADQDFMPLVSDNWTRNFTWTGDGPMPEAERARLQQIVQTAHADGRRIRFWATPDAPGPQRDAVWRELLAAGVDHINTDDLAGLQAFLTAADEQGTAIAA
jgi:hypothetical protein